MFIISEFTLRRVGHISKISDTFEGDCCEMAVSVRKEQH